MAVRQQRSWPAKRPRRNGPSTVQAASGFRPKCWRKLSSTSKAIGPEPIKPTVQARVGCPAAVGPVIIGFPAYGGAGEHRMAHRNSNAIRPVSSMVLAPGRCRRPGFRFRRAGQPGSHITRVAGTLGSSREVAIGPRGVRALEGRPYDRGSGRWVPYPVCDKTAL